MTSALDKLTSKDMTEAEVLMCARCLASLAELDREAERDGEEVGDSLARLIDLFLTSHAEMILDLLYKGFPGEAA